jgi:hypothetical protein
LVEVYGDQPVIGDEQFVSNASLKTQFWKLRHAIRRPKAMNTIVSGSLDEWSGHDAVTTQAAQCRIMEASPMRVQ